MKLISPRLLQHVEARAHVADNPNWSSAKHFVGTSSATDMVPVELPTHASCLTKEEAELEAFRMNARTPGASSQPRPCAASAATLTGGLLGLRSEAGDGKRGSWGRRRTGRG